MHANPLLIFSPYPQSDPPRGLPSLFLIDSIIKNIGQPYIELFSKSVETLFVRLYEMVRKP